MSRMTKWLTAAALVASVAALPTAASARWHGGWGWGAGAAGFGIGLGLGAAAASPYYGYYGPGPYYYGGGPYAYAGGCWRSRRVWTPYGWRWRRVNVCY